MDGTKTMRLSTSRPTIKIWSCPSRSYLRIPGAAEYWHGRAKSDYPQILSPERRLDATPGGEGRHRAAFDDRPQRNRRVGDERSSAMGQCWHGNSAGPPNAVSVQVKRPSRRTPGLSPEIRIRNSVDIPGIPLCAVAD